MCFSCQDEVTVVELTLEALAADATSGGNVTSAPTERQQQVNGTEEPAAQGKRDLWIGYGILKATTGPSCC